MRILIAGATGAIGRPLVRCLKENRHSVFALARTNPEELERPEDAFRQAQADEDRNALAPLRCEVGKLIAQAEKIAQSGEFAPGRCPSQERQKMEASINALRQLSKEIGDSLKALNRPASEEFKRLEGMRKEGQVNIDSVFCAKCGRDPQVP